MLNLSDTTEIFVFGDSLSDSGSSFALTFGAIPPDPPYFSGRFSNGSVAVEYLAEDWGLTLNPYYDDGDGNNFAVGGAKTGIGNSNNDDIAPFLPGVTLPGVSKQIADFELSLEGDSADPDALYIVWAGPNDFLDYLGGSVPADPAILIEDGISNNVDNVNRLADLGANNIVVPNMPSLGRLPFSTEFQDEATAISIAYNGGLSLALDNLDLVDNSPETVVTQVDLFTANENIAANPEEFGLSNITDPLLLLGLDSTTTGYFFWDLFHPTTEAHALFTDTIAQTLGGEIPQPTF
jgi:phospholipase/lecithinase/hemolysin